MSKGLIRMYSTRWCGDCFRAKAFLESRGVAYEEVDIERDAEAAALVMRANEGKRRVPTFEIEGAYHGNPRLDELARLTGVKL